MCCRGSCLIVGRTSKQGVQVMGVAFCDDNSVERWQSWSKSGRPLMSWLSQVAELSLHKTTMIDFAGAIWRPYDIILSAI